MAGGQRIDDHSFWAGKKSEGSVFPMGVHLKSESSEEGAGELNMYEDTTEAIKKQQSIAVGKAKAYKQREHYRN